MKIWIVFPLILITTACAYTNISSFKDPAFNSTKYGKVLILANFRDLGFQQRNEQRACNGFKAYGIECVHGITLLPPTQELPSKTELLRRCKENGINAYLIISMTGAGASQAYVPQSSETYGRVSTFGRYHSTTNTYGGYNVSKPHASFEIRLIDVETEKAAWIATPASRGNAFADYDDLVASVIDKSIEQIQRDGLLLTRQAPKN